MFSYALELRAHSSNVTSRRGSEHRRTPHRGVATLAILLVAGAAPAMSQTATLQGLGDLSGGNIRSDARAISADGSTIVGSSISENGTEAFRWTEMGMAGLGDLPNGEFMSTAYAVSADGSVVVGRAKLNGVFVACRWDASGAAPLPVLPGWSNYSTAYGVSGNGLVIGGCSSTNATGGDNTLATAWTDGSALGLPDIPNAENYGTVNGANFDGRTLVGNVRDTSGRDQACYWIDGQLFVLPRLPGGPSQPAAQALGISSDGRVMVGQSPSINGSSEACLWINGSAQGLGDLPGAPFASHAWAANQDGSVIVGDANSTGGDAEQRTACVWDSQHGMRELQQVLSDLGADVTGWTLHMATGVSDDGTAVCGVGRNPAGDIEAFVARVPCFRAPLIVTSPQSQSACLGRSVTLQVGVSGPGPLSLQWRKNMVPISEPGATNPTLVLHDVSLADAAEYDVVVSNACGEVISDPATLQISTLTGDLNCDCQVDLTDLATMLANFGTTCP